jgi:glycine cleavage system H protein
VVVLNGALSSASETVNSDPLGEGWMIKIKIVNPDEIGKLLDAEDYKATLEA